MPNSASGRFVLRLPPALHRRLQEASRKLGISLNQACVDLLSSAISQAPNLNINISQALQKATDKFAEKLIGVVLFGSAARGDTHDESDFDLLFVLHREVNINRDLYRDWEEEFDRKISVHFAHLPEQADSAGSLWLECAMDGSVLRDSQNILRRRLNQIRDFITSGKVVRRVTHGQGYWTHV